VRRGVSRAREHLHDAHLPCSHTHKRGPGGRPGEEGAGSREEEARREAGEGRREELRLEGRREEGWQEGPGRDAFIPTHPQPQPQAERCNHTP